MNLTDDKSVLVQVKSGRRQATVHYLNQSWGAGENGKISGNVRIKIQEKKMIIFPMFSYILRRAHLPYSMQIDPGNWPISQRFSS